MGEGATLPSPMAQNSAAKWEGRVSEALTVAAADQIWPMLKDFFNFHKWFPNLATCYGLSGINGEGGCVRFCSGFSIPSSDAHDHVLGWSKERLVAVDDHSCRICYEIVDSNLGFKSYMSTIEIAPGDGGGVIEWRFTVEPVEGLTLEDLVKKYEEGLRSMAKRMEAAVEQQRIRANNPSGFVCKNGVQAAEAKWEGEVTAEVPAGKPEEIWPLLADDFCNLHKWLPIDTCRHVEGVPGKPGLIRYCATTDTTSSPAPSIKWAHERLNLIDPTAHVLTYEILENNIGFKSYVATFKLRPIHGGGCKIVWSFVADPIEGWPPEEFVKYLHFSLHHMAEKMGDFLHKSG